MQVLQHDAGGGRENTFSFGVALQKFIDTTKTCYTVHLPLWGEYPYVVTHPPYSKQLEEHVGGKEVRQVIDDEVAKQRHKMDEVVEEYKIKWVACMIALSGLCVSAIKYWDLAWKEQVKSHV